MSYQTMHKHKQRKTIHNSEIREGDVAWRFEIDHGQGLVNLTYVVPAGEWTIPIPRERLPAIIAHLRRALTELAAEVE